MLVTISHCVQININQIKTERHAAPSTEVSRAAAAAAAAASTAASSRSAIWGMGVTSRGAATRLQSKIRICSEVGPIGKLSVESVE